MTNATYLELAGVFNLQARSPNLENFASTEVKQSATTSKQQSLSAAAELSRAAEHHDPRWALAQRVVAGPHFARSSLLSNFLLYVVSECLAERSEAISEHRIGVAVFGRPNSYSTDEDNIVRNYARQLRKRLADHFAGVGRDEQVQIQIPLGGYVPLFLDECAPAPASETNQGNSSKQPPTPSLPGTSNPVATSAPLRAQITRSTLTLIVVAIAIGIAWFGTHHLVTEPPTSDASHPLWKAILGGPGNTFLVPADAGFNLLEDASQRSFSLSSYINGTYASTPGGKINRHTDQDLRTQEYTDFVSMQIAVSVARRPEFDPQHVLLRFPRDLRINDLKSANALIIGSVCANPWADFAGSTANFRIVSNPDMEGAQIVNSRPLPGEAPVYASHWNEPAHDTFALILFLPNLDGSGHVLVIEGLDIAGTQAAAELLFQPNSITPILTAARRNDGTLRPFEILLRATSIESNAAGTRIIASRIH